MIVQFQILILFLFQWSKESQKYCSQNSRRVGMDENPVSAAYAAELLRSTFWRWIKKKEAYFLTCA